MKGEFEEFSDVFLKKYNMNACIVDKVWNEILGDYLYCLMVDDSITDDPNDLLLSSLTYDDIRKMM